MGLAGVLAHNAKDPLAPWTISEADYPFSGDTREQLSFCLNYAVLAPSGHNTQPWRFKLELDELKLFADRTRALPVVDPRNRELIMSCGAALFHLRLAIRYFGHADEVYWFPEITNRDLLAVVGMGQPRAMKGDELSMFHSITRRRTNRHPFDRRPVHERILASLKQAAEAEQAGLIIVESKRSRRQVAQLISQGDRAQMNHAPFRRELAAWIHSARSTTCDGIPGYAYGVNQLLDFATPACAFALRTFDLGKGVAAHDLKLVAGSPVLAVLVTGTDSPTAWLSAGQALARVLLLACAHGISASFLNQPIEVEGLRPVLRETLALPGFPQILLRLGYGPEVKPTPRRNVQDMLIQAGPWTHGQ
jgi:nitroreductase